MCLLSFSLLLVDDGTRSALVRMPWPGDGMWHDEMFLKTVEDDVLCIVRVGGGRREKFYFLAGCLIG